MVPHDRSGRSVRVRLPGAVRHAGTGHADAAYRFCDEAWPVTGPASEQAKRAFLAAFQERLAESLFRSAIEALGHPPLPAIERKGR